MKGSEAFTACPASNFGDGTALAVQQAPYPDNGDPGAV
jgi:hypothetical protein